MLRSWPMPSRDWEVAPSGLGCEVTWPSRDEETLLERSWRLVLVMIDRIPRSTEERSWRSEVSVQPR